MTEVDKKIALITGITGQDGSYLAELLLSKGYEVHGMIRRNSTGNSSRINHIFDKIHLHYGDMTDTLSIDKIISDSFPDEIYNLAAQSHVQVSFEQPDYTSNVDALGTLRLLESAKRFEERCKDVKIYQASTSEMFGRVLETPQSEKTLFNPVSPYGASKVYAYYMSRMYREAYGMFVTTGILFNHESPRRGRTFVTKKIVDGLQNFAYTVTDYVPPVKLGNLDAKRDWGHAKDYVYAMWLMMQQEKPEDYVIATGKQYTVREFADAAAKTLNMPIEWHNVGTQKEFGVCQKTGRILIEVDEKYFRPAEVETLLGDASKARFELGWTPEYSFQELVWDMCYGY